MHEEAAKIQGRHGSKSQNGMTALGISLFTLWSTTLTVSLLALLPGFSPASSAYKNMRSKVYRASTRRKVSFPLLYWFQTLRAWISILALHCIFRLIQLSKLFQRLLSDLPNSPTISEAPYNTKQSPTHKDFPLYLTWAHYFPCSNVQEKTPYSLIIIKTYPWTAQAFISLCTGNSKV